MRNIFVWEILSLTLFLSICVTIVSAEERSKCEVTVGVATILSGDLSTLGQNIARTIALYKKIHLRHQICFEFQDAKKSSIDGLKAYQYLINVKQVDMLIGGTTSNGTIAGKNLINKTKTVTITPLTGGSNIDQAGPYIFRIGNSDVMNGYEQAEYFMKKNFKRVAIITEDTQYTQDISTHFRKRFVELGGELAFDQSFLPDNTDFRSQIVVLKSKKPDALFMSTQTGLAFGIFVKQFNELKGISNLEIHTNFLAASNPEALTVGGEAMYGIHYMAPKYDGNSSSPYQLFAAEYRGKYHEDPTIPFHTAGTVDILNILQDYLDINMIFSKDGFQQYLLAHIKNYRGLMGTYSFNQEGNADIGFEPAVIEKQVH